MIYQFRSFHNDIDLSFEFYGNTVLYGITYTEFEMEDEMFH